MSIAPIECVVACSLFSAIGWYLAGPLGLLATLLPAIPCSLAIGAVAALSRFARVVRRNQLGLCPGIRQSAQNDDVPALTEWLDTILQSLSGQADRPLLFDDLWNAPRYPREPESDKSLSLTVITTDVSHHEPRSLPFQKAAFWFKRQEFNKLFPSNVVDWMVDQDKHPVSLNGENYYRLPEGGQLPVLVATRMSLSFPVLISAVPLHEGTNWEVAPESTKGKAETTVTDGIEKYLFESAESLAVGGKSTLRRPSKMRRCWFSDGGISSNFPVHLFDAALPRWPTFAIDLTYPEKDGGMTQPRVFLPTENNQGWQPRYSRIAAGNALAEVARFLFAIIGTMQNWRDVLQARAPGCRDRIVHVGLSGHEGGMNLNMPQEVLDAIAQKGEEAGQALARDFDFNNHWWVRWRNVATGLETFTIEVSRGASPPVGTNYAVAQSAATTGSPRAPSYRFTVRQQAEAQDRLKIMVDQGALWASTKPSLSEGTPRPIPQLRISPTF